MSVIAGNWKMNYGPDRISDFFRELDLSEVGDRHEVIVFPPAVSLCMASTCPERDARVSLGAQNVYWETSGAFTGEISVAMATQAGAQFVLVGHSERRHLFGESDEDVARKTAAVIRGGITPVVCVGETLRQRRAGRVEEVVCRQLDVVLGALADSGARILVAYEPVWAIGTGETASPEDASAAHEAIRHHVEATLGQVVAQRLQILYGGSVTPSNARSLLGTSGIDGVLVGGGSLDAGSFSAIARAAPTSASRAR